MLWERGYRLLQYVAMRKQGSCFGEGWDGWGSVGEVLYLVGEIWGCGYA